MDLKQSAFEPVIDKGIELNSLEDPVVLSFMKLGRNAAEHRDIEISTCIGDIYKIINMLHDYAHLLSEAVSQWNLKGWQKAMYELHAEQSLKIADKYAAAIGYDYDKALETCRKRSSRKKQDDGVGEDALVHVVRGSPQKKDKQKPGQPGDAKKETEEPK